MYNCASVLTIVVVIRLEPLGLGTVLGSKCLFLKRYYFSSSFTLPETLTSGAENPLAAKKIVRSFEEVDAEWQ
eukprot:3170873-Rhodomonas_salina.5